MNYIVVMWFGKSRLKALKATADEEDDDIAVFNSANEASAVADKNPYCRKYGYTIIPLERNCNENTRANY